jgi:hypothetical protein
MTLLEIEFDALTGEEEETELGDASSLPLKVTDSAAEPDRATA